MNAVSEQEGVWIGDFGAAYTARNRFDDPAAFEQLYVDRFGVGRAEINRAVLGELDRGITVVEVGCNVGNQLAALARDGFRHLYGVDIQAAAVAEAHQKRPALNVVEGSALDLPFKNGFADLVFTNNVLIHIAPDNLGQVMNEMTRVSRRYIWGFEYYAPELQEVPYRGHNALLWKADYSGLFQQRFPELKLVYQHDYPYRDGSGLVDRLYLLEKPVQGAA